MFYFYVKTIILGIIEALSEFFPISSTAHLELAHYLLAFNIKNIDSFIIFIQIGPILAAFFVYYKTFIGLIPPISVSKWKDYFFNQPISPMHFIVSILPVVFVGAIFYHTIKLYLSSIVVLASGLLLGSVFLWFAERQSKKYKQQNKIAVKGKISYKQAFLIGLGQCLALFPGMSRSGSTIGAALFVKVERQTAANFSFIIAVPVTLAATVLDLFKSPIPLTDSTVPLFLLGFVVSFVMAFAAIRLFLYILGKIGLMPFIIYRIILGIGILITHFMIVT